MLKHCRPKTYFLQPNVAIPLGFALLREIWNQKVTGRQGGGGAVGGVGGREGGGAVGVLGSPQLSQGLLELHVAPAAVLCGCLKQRVRSQHSPSHAVHAAFLHPAPRALHSAPAHAARAACPCCRCWGGRTRTSCLPHARPSRRLRSKRFILCSGWGGGQAGRLS